MTRTSYPEGEVYSPDFKLTPKQSQAAHELLKAGVALHEKTQELQKLLPYNSYSQFFGNWNILKIKLVEKGERED